MRVLLKSDRFDRAHKAFTEHMLEKSGGVSFTGFGHPFLFKDEIAYKVAIYRRASQALDLDKWEQRLRTRGAILASAREACTHSGNLLEHRYGDTGSSAAPLYRVEGRPAEVEGLEKELYAFFRGGVEAPESFGPRFDAFAGYLRDKRLSCKWDFLAYLAFLLSPQRYFPIRPTYFDGLLHFYGIDRKIAGAVSWANYRLLLDLADDLRERLAVYGSADGIEIQSYMWVVAYLVKDGKIPPKLPIQPPDFAQELARRKLESAAREQTGLLGEQLVYELEASRLCAAGRPDLAARMELKSADGSGCAYDILSFDLQGNERHIEVKTTKRGPSDDEGFWLTERERECGTNDPAWTVVRVSDVDRTPQVEDLGKILANGAPGWRIQPATWYVQRITREW